MIRLLNSPDKQRRRLLNKIDKGVFRNYLEHQLPNITKTTYETEFLSLDFETSGLNAKQEAILSIGYTVIRQGRICLKENGHHIVKINRDIPPESIVIHKITDDQAKQGIHLHDALEILLAKMAGRVLLVHYNKIERSFLNAACKQVYGYEPPMIMVDTLALAKRTFDRLPQPYNPKRLRLFNLRNEYGLPRYNAHSSLEDAIATAELLLVQLAHQKGLKKTILKEIIC
jgi:DNA polymerase-3 subunit epsilon